MFVLQSRVFTFAAATTFVACVVNFVSGSDVPETALLHLRPLKNLTEKFDGGALNDYLPTAVLDNLSNKEPLASLSNFTESFSAGIAKELSMSMKPMNLSVADEIIYNAAKRVNDTSHVITNEISKGLGATISQVNDFGNRRNGLGGNLTHLNIGRSGRPLRASQKNTRLTGERPKVFDVDYSPFRDINKNMAERLNQLTNEFQEQWMLSAKQNIASYRKALQEVLYNMENREPIMERRKN